MEKTKKYFVTLAVGIVLTTLSLAPVAMAKPYYQGKTINLVMGLGPSSGGATVARLLSKHLTESIEGNPKVVVQHMPGAALMKAHLFVLQKAPKDGTTIYYGPRSPLGELLQLPGHTFRYSEFTILGGIQVAGLVIYVRTDVMPGGLKKASDINKASGLIYGGISPEHGRMIISMMGLDLLGLKYNFVPGYKGSGKIRAAIINGEINIATDAAHAYLNRAVPQLVDKGKGIPLFSIPLLKADGSLVKNQLVPDVPFFLDLYKEVQGGYPSGPSWDTMKALIEVDQTMQHAFLGPPNMNNEATAAFRKAFMPAFTSREFVAESKKVLTYAVEPVGYERAIKVLGATSKISPEVVEFIKGNIAKNSR